ncbi:MAG: lipoyl synthase, partial [Polyangia bacterium]
METLKRSRYSKAPSASRLHLPVLGTSPAPSPSTEPEAPRRRLPPWIKAKLPTGEAFFELRELVHEERLHTVCESASCPNIGECWNRKALTIMILGGICTRSCQFCDVPTGKPEPVDHDE